MSNVYIQEPPTLGKVLLVTTVGDIDVELWSKEAPKACRNFVQLCLEGYYNATIFHRVVKDFIVQGGDPTGTGQGGQSIYGEPFKDEIHSRLRFNRRGLVAMANAGRDDNGSQFFFTLGPTPELQGKHTIFAKVVGDTIYNMIKLDADTDENEKPLHCHKIIKAEILNNPFPDIVPRVRERKEKKEKKRERDKGVKNFKLLSFGEEAEGDEEETLNISRSSKIKSSHDVLDDPKLSKASALDPSISESRLTKVDEETDVVEKSKSEDSYDEGNDGDDRISSLYDFEKNREEELLKKRAEIQKQIQELKDDYRSKKRDKEPSSSSTKDEPDKKEIVATEDNELLSEYKTNLVKYSQLKTKLPLKGADRQSFTMEMLSKFKNKLKEKKESVSDERQETPTNVEVGEDYDGNDGSWMTHTLRFENKIPVLARDASTKNDDWYDITDPRNPLVKRRREESEKVMAKLSKRMRD